MEHATHELGPLLIERVSYLWLIPLFPLVGAAINATLGLHLQRAAGKKAVHAIAVGAMVLSLLVAVYALAEMLGLPPERRFLQDTRWDLLTAGRLTVEFGFALDPLSMLMVMVVTFVGTLIHVFSIGYMADEKPYWRFFAWLNLFIFSMLLLVMGDNFAVMFFGWEGVGLCSYLLISYYYTEPEKAAAGMKAFVVNRIGDFGFLAGLFMLFWALGGAWAPRDDMRGSDYRPAAGFNAVAPATSAAESRALAPVVEGIRVGPTLNFRELRDQVVIEKTGIKEHLQGQQIWGFSLLAVIGILLFVGAMGKSAQLPLYVWLPDAMAGPTPVSALIHAATMVTAGVYMVARLSFLYALSPTAMGWVAAIGAATALFSASIGFFQYDIKKVLAYSTVSQLGFMFIGVGVGAYWAGAYHLLTHAFFKACLFLGSGSVILGCHHEQDMRKMGGLKKTMPTTHWTYLVACIAIAGFPVAAGFYSKDEILWKAFGSNHLALLGFPAPWLGPLIYVVGIVAATGTSFYMFRSYYMTFTGAYRGGEGHGEHAAPDAHAAADHAAQGHDAPGHADAHGAGSHDPAGHGHGGGTPHESPRTITWVLAALAIGSVLSLFLGLPQLWTHQAPALEQFLEPSLPAQIPFAEKPHALEWLFQGIGVLAGAAGWFFARLLYKDARSAVPEELRQRWNRAWTVVYNKYYVDELYDAVVVRPSVFFAKFLSWFDGHVIDWLVNFAGWIARLFANIDGAIDKYLVDGAVNAVAAATIEGGRALRKVQTGRIQTYLYGALAGGLAVILLNFLIR
jgi:NADH-quinone oxidoreductase subunit L